MCSGFRRHEGDGGGAVGVYLVTSGDAGGHEARIAFAAASIATTRRSKNSFSILSAELIKQPIALVVESSGSISAIASNLGEL